MLNERRDTKTDDTKDDRKVFSKRKREFPELYLRQTKQENLPGWGKQD